MPGQSNVPDASSYTQFEFLIGMRTTVYKDFDGMLARVILARRNQAKLVRFLYNDRSAPFEFHDTKLEDLGPKLPVRYVKFSFVGSWTAR